MKIRIIHPLWTHLPVLGLLVYLAVRLILAAPLPASAPIRFDFDGQPNAYGAPWMVFGLTLGMVLMFGIISVVIDEAWARNEKVKYFNWMCPFDELVAGALVGISLGYLKMLENGLDTFRFPLVEVLLTTGIALALAVVLELIRPSRPNPVVYTEEDTASWAENLRERLRGDHSFVYWQSQNPFWVNIVTLGLPVLMLVLAVVLWFNQTWLSLLYILIAIGVSLLYGGLRTIITREKITVRLGRLRVLNILTAEIASAEIMEFSPIRDFSGYGIRFNGKTWAYFLKGNRGVKITLNHGMQYLIGTEHPERLLAVIKAVSGKPG